MSQLGFRGGGNRAGPKVWVAQVHTNFGCPLLLNIKKKKNIKKNISLNIKDFLLSIKKLTSNPTVPKIN
jgi:hypothetical protein